MPHAENDTMSSQSNPQSAPLTNGEVPQSQFLNHIASYPVVQDATNKVKSNPYGQKSLELASANYTRFVAPVLPYLATPYSYVAPYLSKADGLADTTLEKVDAKFPIVKEDSHKIWDATLSYALYPVRLATEGKQYLAHTYADESGKTEGKGLAHTVKAVISTDLKVISDVAQWLADYLGPRKEELEKKAGAKKEQAKEKLNG